MYISDFEMMGGGEGALLGYPIHITWGVGGLEGDFMGLGESFGDGVKIWNIPLRKELKNSSFLHLCGVAFLPDKPPVLTSMLAVSWAPGLTPLFEGQEQ